VAAQRYRDVLLGLVDRETDRMKLAAGTAPDVMPAPHIPRPRSDQMIIAITPQCDRAAGVGAQIISELGVHDMELLTNARHSLVGLDGYDLSIVGERPRFAIV